MRSVRHYLGLAATIITVLSAAPAHGCLGGIIEVSQPMLTPEGIWVSSVSYSRNCLPTGGVPGYEVLFVGEPNCVCMETPPGGSDNLNAANLLGIKTDIDPIHRRTSMLLGDTLHVIIDVSGLPVETEELHRQLLGWSVDAVVSATVECVLWTASRNRLGRAYTDATGYHPEVEAKFVWLEIRGSEKYASLGGVFSFDALGALPRNKLFW